MDPQFDPKLFNNQEEYVNAMTRVSTNTEQEIKLPAIVKLDGVDHDKIQNIIDITLRSLPGINELKLTLVADDKLKWTEGRVPDPVSLPTKTFKEISRTLTAIVMATENFVGFRYSIHVDRSSGSPVVTSKIELATVEKAVKPNSKDWQPRVRVKYQPR